MSETSQIAFIHGHAGTPCHWTGDRCIAGEPEGVRETLANSGHWGLYHGSATQPAEGCKQCEAEARLSSDCGCPVRYAPEIRGDSGDTLVMHDDDCEYGVCTGDRAYCEHGNRLGEQLCTYCTYENVPDEIHVPTEDDVLVFSLVDAEYIGRPSSYERKGEH